MHRVTARSLLVLLLVVVFVPVGLAIAATPPHAWCLRKTMHDGSPHSQFQGPPGCCQHDCCRPLTVSQWAHVSLSARGQDAPSSATLRFDPRSDLFAVNVNDVHSGRAPPQFSIA